MDSAIVLIPSISGLHLNRNPDGTHPQLCLNPLYFGATSKSELQRMAEAADRLNPLYFGATSKSRINPRSRTGPTMS